MVQHDLTVLAAARHRTVGSSRQRLTPALCCMGAPAVAGTALPRALPNCGRVSCPARPLRPRADNDLTRCCYVGVCDTTCLSLAECRHLRALAGGAAV